MPASSPPVTPWMTCAGTTRAPPPWPSDRAAAGPAQIRAATVTATAPKERESLMAFLPVVVDRPPSRLSVVGAAGDGRGERLGRAGRGGAADGFAGEGAGGGGGERGDGERAGDGGGETAGTGGHGGLLAGDWRTPRTLPWPGRSLVDWRFI